jgi:hypothetical protein
MRRRVSRVAGVVARSGLGVCMPRRHGISRRRRFRVGINPKSRDAGAVARSGLCTPWEARSPSCRRRVAPASLASSCVHFPAGPCVSAATGCIVLGYRETGSLFGIVCSRADTPLLPTAMNTCPVGLRVSGRHFFVALVHTRASTQRTYARIHATYTYTHTRKVYMRACMQ